MFCRSVCFYYSTILTNPPLCSGREDVDLCFYTSEEIMNSRKGEERGIGEISLLSFPKYQVVYSEGLECWNRT